MGEEVDKWGVFVCLRWDVGIAMLLCFPLGSYLSSFLFA